MPCTEVSADDANGEREEAETAPAVDADGNSIASDVEAALGQFLLSIVQTELHAVNDHTLILVRGGKP